MYLGSTDCNHVVGDCTLCTLDQLTVPTWWTNMYLGSTDCNHVVDRGRICTFDQLTVTTWWENICTMCTLDQLTVTTWWTNVLSPFSRLMKTAPPAPVNFLNLYFTFRLPFKVRKVIHTIDLMCTVRQNNIV